MEIIFPEEPIISDEARDFITACCTRDAKQRPDIDSLLRHPWFGLEKTFENMTQEERIEVFFSDFLILNYLGNQEKIPSKTQEMCCNSRF